MDDKKVTEAINYIKEHANEEYLSKLSDEQFKELSELIDKIDKNLNE